MTVGLARCLPRYDNDHRTPERRSKRGGPQPPPYPRHSQPYPGHEPEMRPRPDFGETSYRGAQRLLDKKVIITGGDSGRTCITQEQHCYGLVERAIVEFGQVDVLVNNAAYQMSRDGVEAITTDEWDHTLKTNLYAMFWLCKAAFPKMRQGGAIINTSSIQAYQPSPNLLAYATTKGAIVTLPRRCLRRPSNVAFASTPLLLGRSGPHSFRALCRWVLSRRSVRTRRSGGPANRPS